MRVEYWCKHCHHFVGELNRPDWTRADAERYSGLAQFTAGERAQYVVDYGDPHVMSVQTVCDHCQNAIERHPELLIEGKLLQ